MKKTVIIAVIIVVVAVAAIYVKTQLRVVKFVSYDAATKQGIFKVNGRSMTLTSDPSRALNIGGGLSIRARYNYAQVFEGWELVDTDNTILSLYYIAQEPTGQAYIKY